MQIKTLRKPLNTTMRTVEPFEKHDRAAKEDIIAFARSVSAGFKATPRIIQSRFLYDARGSMLFEQITRQPEYYLTRTEASILAASARDIRESSGAATLVELGSGNSEKTDHLLRAWLSRDTSVTYVPIDVCRSALAKAERSIVERHPAVQVQSMNMDYRQAFETFPALSPALVLFLGSSIGNFDEEEMSSFLQALHDAMEPGDYLLGGFDLVKSPRVIEAAYNDTAGVTARFTLNLFDRMNRELGSGIRLDGVQHSAVYRADRERVEIDAVFTATQEVTIKPLGETHTIHKGERIRTEICRKFRIETLCPFLDSIGFRTKGIFTDKQQWFALILLQKER